MCFRLIPESVRWLLTKNRTYQAKRIILRVAKFNGQDLPEDDLLEQVPLQNGVQAEGVGRDKPPSVLDLFRSPVLRIRSAVLFYIW